ncbi:dihydroneopterin aldolase [Aquisalimonas sp. 2447]|uniref:dihydroneopterin aldolase n=1 Tax=Aquisalimonas sp. 2447 TaxID=2740807 RepID=UPI001432440D|nr:dihydroneopterin aldolase [Aquisalimonas sp. 2447]QIT56891.1 dihydroneopterin aldolase [Aquisalimonas sp. 2447]
MDVVFIQELKVDTVIGVRDWERRVRQTLVLDLELGCDAAAAAATDAVDDAVDYDAVRRHVAEWVANAGCQLVEGVAEGVATELQRAFGVPWLRIRVAKPGAVPGARAVGVSITRGEESR